MKTYQISKKGCAVFAKQDEKNEKLFVACPGGEGGKRHILPVGAVLKTASPIAGKMRLVTAVIADADETARADAAEDRVKELEAELAKLKASKSPPKKAAKEAKAAAAKPAAKKAAAKPAAKKAAAKPEALPGAGAK